MQNTEELRFTDSESGHTDIVKSKYVQFTDMQQAIDYFGPKQILNILTQHCRKQAREQERRKWLHWTARLRERRAGKLGQQVAVGRKWLD